MRQAGLMSSCSEDEDASGYDGSLTDSSEEEAPDFEYIPWHMKTSSRANFVEFKAKHKT
jgi:hypothetical protein